MKYFITGITGTLGSIVAERLLHQGRTVIGFSRDECKQVAFPKHERLTLYLGDIRDRDRLVEATRGVGQILHFAALKHVDKLEENPEEAVLTNILGTMNVLHAQRANKVPRVLLAATDKGAYPINTYGMSKGIAERLVLRNPMNTVCRYGNVLASRGSVVEKIVKSLKTENKAYLTDRNMTRFWLRIEDAADFVLNAREKPGLQIPEMKASTVEALAASIARCLNVPTFQTVDTGFRAGEKMHETLRTEYEGEEISSLRAERFTDTEMDDMLKPIVEELVKCRY